jgi:phosphoribosylamine-glycine ligase
LDLESARERAYAAVDAVHFGQMHVRRDIALSEMAKD